MILDWEKFENTVHAGQIHETKIRSGDVTVCKLASGAFRFPVADGSLYPKHLETYKGEQQQLFKDIRLASKRKVPPPRKDTGADFDDTPKDETDLLPDDNHVEETPLPEPDMEETPPVRREPPEEPKEDYWIMPNNHMLKRVHVKPRTYLFVPSREDCPVPLEWLDIMRETRTDLRHNGLAVIHDFWTADGRVERRELDEEWTGITIFEVMRIEPAPGFQWADGRLTKIHKDTRRPPNVWPEVWSSWSEGRQAREI